MDWRWHLYFVAIIVTIVSLALVTRFCAVESWVFTVDCEVISPGLIRKTENKNVPNTVGNYTQTNWPCLKDLSQRTPPFVMCTRNETHTTQFSTFADVRCRSGDFVAPVWTTTPDDFFSPYLSVGRRGDIDIAYAIKWGADDPSVWAAMHSTGSRFRATYSIDEQELTRGRVYPGPGVVSNSHDELKEQSDMNHRLSWALVPLVVAFILGMACARRADRRVSRRYTPDTVSQAEVELGVVGADVAAVQMDTQTRDYTAEKRRRELYLASLPSWTWMQYCTEMHGSTQYSSRAVETQCSVCLMDFDETILTATATPHHADTDTYEEDLVVLPDCHHVYHRRCLGKWYRQRVAGRCPLCKNNFTETAGYSEDDTMVAGHSVPLPLRTPQPDLLQH
eukprot:GFYU01000515.1.p1 GENE.GFYU01000515.1~~GFYU01000515.1.p1  ORF type:complete len:393 (-),score=63.95 GFYU01000515.1:64-1242(-)